MKGYAASVMAFNGGYINHRVVLFNAQNEREANRRAIELALEAYPEFEGYSDHSVTVICINDHLA